MAHRTFCTYFDSNYATRGLALYESLVQHCPAFTLWVCCCDADAYQLLSELQLPHMRLITLRAVEAEHPELLTVKPQRGVVEYYFTVTPFLPRYVFDHDAAAEHVTYLDADLYFFSSPEPLFAEIGDAALGVIEHRYANRRAEANQELYGRFNVGWITFRRSQTADACLARWSAQCIEWCMDHPEDGKYGDQKYLDAWPERYPDLHIIEHPGANAASWNLPRYTVTAVGDRIYFDGQPLIFYHFDGFKPKASWLFDTNASLHDVELSRTVRRYIYGPYIQKNMAISARHRHPIKRGLRLRTKGGQAPARRSRLEQFRTIIRTVLRGQQVVVVNGWVL